MTWHIRIGETYLNHAEPTAEGDPRPEVGRSTAREAPVFPGQYSTRNGNTHLPTVWVWHDFLLAMGLVEWWQRVERVCEAAYVYPVGEGDLATVRAAREAYQGAHPEALPGYADTIAHSTREHLSPEEVGRLDATLARALWLEWWIGWALKRALAPAIEASC